MKILYLDSDYEFEYAITQKNADSGEVEPAEALTGLSGRLSATDGGSTIHVSLLVTADERSAKPGTYFGVFQGDDLRANAEPLAGKIAYIVFGDTTNVLISEPVRVYDRRRPA